MTTCTRVGVGGSHYSFLTQKERDNESGLDYFGARYYSSAQGRFTSDDPREITLETDRLRFLTYLSNPQSWNQYCYVLNNPLALKDLDGREPNKAQAGTAQQVVAIIREIEKRNPDASPREILSMTNKYFTDQRDQPGAVRYVFTKESGWIDSKHFFAAADKAADRGEVITNLLGIGVEVWQSIQGNSSAFSYEDLGSNAAGADFGDDVFNSSAGPFSGQVEKYLTDNLKAVEPTQASNYGALPSGVDNRSGRSRANQSADSRTSSTNPVSEQSERNTKSAKNAPPPNQPLGRRP